MTHCQSCGAPVNSGQHFCANCGTRIPPPPPVDYSTSPGVLPADQPVASYPPAPEPRPAQRAGAKKGILIAKTVAAVLVLGAAAVLLPRLTKPDSQRSAISLFGLPLGLAAGVTSEPEMQWDKSGLGCPEAEESFSGCSAVADGGRVFVLSGDDHSFQLTAFDLGDGKEIWKTEERDGFGLVPLVGEGLVVTSTYDEEGSEIVAFDADDGARRWTFGGDGGTFSSGYFAGGNLIAFEYGEGDKTTTVAIDPSNGDEAWSHDGSSAAVDGDTILLLEDGDLVCLDASNGDERWSLSGGDDFRSAIADGGMVYATVDDDVVAVDGDGEERWKVDAGMDDLYSVAVLDGTVIAVGTEDVQAFKASDGKKTWKGDAEDFRGGDAEQYADVATLLSDGRLLVAAGGGRAELIDVDDGKSVERTDLDGETLLALADEVLYAVSEEEMVAYDSGNLEERWRIDIDDPGILVAGDEAIIVLNGDRMTVYR